MFPDPTPPDRHALAQAQAEAAALRKQLETLTYGVSHDMRSPLRGIETHAQMLMKKMGDGLDQPSRMHLDGIRDASQRLGGLLDGLLELSRASRAPLRPAQVDVSLLADWSAAELQDVDGAAQPDVTVEVQPGLQVVGDERLLKVLLAQLLTNAWRFTHAAGGGRVQVTGTRKADGLLLEVTDTGIGFDAAQAATILQPFTRLHGAEQGAGHGLGLAVAEQVVMRHRGRIEATGTPGNGATFRVWLPDMEVPPAA